MSDKILKALNNKPKKIAKPKVTSLKKGSKKLTVADTESAQKKTKSKKRPGRPRKKPLKEEEPRRGISHEPADLDNVLEIVYCMPLILKKVVSFFKSLASNEIQIIFRPTHIIFYSRDHHEKSRIRIKIDGHKLNHYYCVKEFSIGVKCGELELILNKVDKDYIRIILMATKNQCQKYLTILMENDMQIEERHHMDLIGQYPTMTNEQHFIDEKYTIHFTFPGKYFKKTINEIKTMSSQLSFIQEDNESPLELGYNSANKKIRSVHTFRNANKVKFYSSLDEHSSFRVTVELSHIKPISSAHIADEITIYLDENKKFMTKALIDNGTIEIKTLTDIVDERPED
jgi:hypothetical protein